MREVLLEFAQPVGYCLYRVMSASVWRQNSRRRQGDGVTWSHNYRTPMLNAAVLYYWYYCIKITKLTKYTSSNYRYRLLAFFITSIIRQHIKTYSNRPNSTRTAHEDLRQGDSGPNPDSGVWSLDPYKFQKLTAIYKHTNGEHTIKKHKNTH